MPGLKQRLMMFFDESFNRVQFVLHESTILGKPDRLKANTSQCRDPVSRGYAAARHDQS
jgi:hypothetical protein